MASTKIDNYISKRYERWLDYASYHCTQAGIPDESHDVLNEVLCSLLQKDSHKLEFMLDAKKNGYTELDFFVLRMIKLNATSNTSPYRNRYKSIPSDNNVDYNCLDIEDVQEKDEDKSAHILERMHQVRDVFESLNLSLLARRVFEFRFFQDNNFADWTGPETLKRLYEIYNGVQDLIRKKISGESIF